MTRHQVRQKMRKQMRRWGMHEDEIALCMVEVKQRQKMKERGDIPRDAPLCTRPAYRIYRREYSQTPVGILESCIDAILDGRCTTTVVPAYDI